MFLLSVWTDGRESRKLHRPTLVWGEEAVGTAGRCRTFVPLLQLIDMMYHLFQPEWVTVPSPAWYRRRDAVISCIIRHSEQMSVV